MYYSPLFHGCMAGVNGNNPPIYTPSRSFGLRECAGQDFIIKVGGLKGGMS